MAPSRRSRAEEEQQHQPEEEEMAQDLVRLQFNEPLSWRAGKAINTSELHRRLDKLSKELTDMEQDDVDTDSFTKVAKELAGHQILAHKDRGVRAYAAACIVEILRICAPNAPFTPAQLKDVFSLFINTTLPALEDPTDAYHNQNKHVLTSLSEVKSILLIGDIDHADNLLLHMFSSFFDMVSQPKPSSGEQIAKDVEYHMTEILTTIIDEGPSLPAKVVDVITAQFLRAAAPGTLKDKSHRAAVDEKQSTLLLKEEPEAYKMAKAICKECPEKMARYVGQYFSDVIMDASGIGGKPNGHGAGADSDDEGGMAGPSEADLKELKKAHLLLRELWRASPWVLQYAVPQVEAELSADNTDLRLLATETLGDMISGIGAAGPPPVPVLDPAAYPPLRLADEPADNGGSSSLTKPYSSHSFAQAHTSAYHEFVGRRNDKAPAIRAAWTTAVGYIVSTSAGGIGLSRDEESLLVQGLGEKLTDSDEKVRLAAVKAIESFCFRHIIAKLAPNGGVDKDGSVLGNLADRCRDKKANVRVDAMALLGKLWGVAVGELAAAQETVTSALGGIPSRIYNTFYANDLELNLLLDRVVFECLLPLGYPPKKASSRAANGNGGSQPQKAAALSIDQDTIRTERILLLVRSLDTSAKKAFFAQQARQPQFAKIVETYLQQCEAYNGGVSDDDPKVKKAKLDRTVQYIAQFLPDSEKVREDLLKFAKAHDRRNYQLVRFIISPEYDFGTVHKAIKELTKRLQGPNIGVLDTLVPLLYRSGCFVFNRSHLSTIMDYSRTDKDGMGSTAHELLNEISQRNADLFKTHIGELCKDLIDKAPDEKTANDPAMVETLKACASFAESNPGEVPGNREFTSTLLNYALYGQPPTAAKYAVSILMAKRDDRSALSATDLLQRSLSKWDYGNKNFLNRLAAIGQLELLAPKVTQDADDEILDMAVQKILLSVRTDAKDSDPEWVEDAELDDECRAKCLCLKILVNRLRGDDAQEPNERSRATFKLLKSLVRKDGEICKVKDTPKYHRNRLRLLAAQSLLKLCKTKHLDEMLGPADFNNLAWVVQSSCPQVRRLFLERLQKYLMRGKLRSRFHTILFIAAFEPVRDVRQRVETFIRSQARRHHNEQPGHGQGVMEPAVARLLSLLAHHPDYSPEPEDLLSHAQYVLFYVDCVVTEANLGLVFRYAERMKQTRDAIDPDKSENLYMLSDLAQVILRKWQEKRGWSFQAYGGKVGMPLGLFSALPSHDAAQAIAEKQYIPDEIDGALDELMKVIDRKKKRKSYDEQPGAAPPAKKAKAARPSQPKTPRPVKPAAAKKAPAKKNLASRPKKAARSTSSSPVPESERRRSGRSRVANTSYMERDSDQDDEEMLEGVAEWEYEKDDSDEESDSAAAAAEPEDENEEPEAMDEGAIAKEPEDDDDNNDGYGDPEEDKAPTPPANGTGRRGRAAAAAAAAAATEAKPAAKAANKGKAAAAAPKAATRATRGRKTKNVFDVDDEGDD